MDAKVNKVKSDTFGDELEITLSQKGEEFAGILATKNAVVVTFRNPVDIAENMDNPKTMWAFHIPK